jgi:ABC-type spermidine/putrescine transport system permease subunit I
MDGRKLHAPIRLAYGAILLRTLILSLVATVLCLVLGFPLALFISRSGKRKSVYLQLVMIPFWTSFLVRTYAWMFLLRDTGLINSTLLAIGVITSPCPCCTTTALSWSVWSIAFCHS